MRKPRVQYVVAKLDQYPQIGDVHGITKHQKLRVILELPAGPTTYDQDAIILDAGDESPPIILWQSQVRLAAAPTKARS